MDMDTDTLTLVIIFPEYYKNIISNGYHNATWKVRVIKLIRELTGLGLKEIKDMCEAANVKHKLNLMRSLTVEELADLSEAGCIVCGHDAIINLLYHSALYASYIGEIDIERSIKEIILPLKLKYKV